MGAGRLLAGVIFSVAFAAAAMAETVKVGVIAPLSGPFSMYGSQFHEAIEVWQAQHGDSPGGNRVELVWRDLTGPNPAQAKALAQELVIREGVAYLAGFVFTPNALAVASLVEEARIPTVIFNAATSAITQKSRFFVRSSYTLWQVTVPLAQYAADQGVRRAVTAVSDYAPGVDGEAAFKQTFAARGGTVTESIRMPLTSTDFAPFMQRIKAAAPEALYVFLPGGPPTYGFVKSFVENGLKAAGIRFLGTVETQETDLPALGEGALGLETAFHYSAAHASPENAAFTSELHRLHPGSVPNFASVGAYDGMALLYRMIEATGGRREPEAAVQAVKGFAWESPRGPVRLDPSSRHIVQNVYIRSVEHDAAGNLVNAEHGTYPAQPDFGLEAGK